MIFRFLKKYQPTVYITILLLGIALFIKPIYLFRDFPVVETDLNMPLYTLLLSVLHGNNFMIVLLGVILIILEAYYLVRLNLKYFFIEKRTYLPAMFFILISAILFLKTGFHPVFIGILFLLISLDKIFKEAEKSSKLSVFFDIGLFIAIGSLFYANLLFFIVFIFWGTISLGILNIRKSLVIITGVLACYFCLWFYYFFTDNTTTFVELFTGNYFGETPSIQAHYTLIAFGIYLSVLFFMSLLSLLFRINQKRIIARKYINVLIILFFIVLLYYFFIPGFSIAVAYILAVPVSFLLTDYFVHIRLKWIGEVFFDILFALIVYIIIVYPL
ncbi:MAG: hypothetical protein GXO79_13580 [Chlorobi bacterium]|nr:hypothetical protein [Chlorobiota bacterium]